MNLNPGTAGVPATPASPVTVRRRGPRGVQAEEVAHAADALLAQGLKPTIERVRQHLGGGSPNTVGPLLDLWFEGLSRRVAGVSAPTEDDLPSNLRSAWNHAKHEARTVANAALEQERAELEQGRAQLAAEQANLSKREAQWSSTHSAIEHALGETRQALEALRGELVAAQTELGELRARSAAEIGKLQALVHKERQEREVARVEHDQTLALREDTWRKERERLEVREQAHERRFLAEVDQARQATKVVEAQFEKEKRRWARWEEAAEITRQAQRTELEEARQSERMLREQLSAQYAALARFEASGQGLENQLTEMRARLDEEKGAHNAARVALAQAIAAVGQRAGKRPSKRTQSGD